LIEKLANSVWDILWVAIRCFLQKL
jgi:hypothetical protein